MARCGCGSGAATGAAAEGSNCVEVTGAGTPLSPFVIAAVISDQTRQLIECSSDGLYARAPIQSAQNDSMVLAAGVGVGDYTFKVQQASDDSADGFNILALLEGGVTPGLGVESWGGTGGDRAINVGFLAADTTLTGSPPVPSERFGAFIGGTHIVALNANGDGNITMPEGFPNNLITVIPVNGDGLLAPFSVALLNVVSNDSFSFHCEPLTATPVASTNVRITYLAFGC